ncbi:MAG: DUF6924 domain-containing protein [Labedaea sp.]
MSRATQQQRSAGVGPRFGAGALPVQVGSPVVTLVIRTDFGHERAWARLVEAIGTPNEDGFMANAEIVDDPDYRALSADQVLGSMPGARACRLVALVDAVTLGSKELPLLVIDQNERPPGRIRVVAREFWSIENNLSLSNMDFHEFVDAAGVDGVFRGF